MTCCHCETPETGPECIICQETFNRSNNSDITENSDCALTVVSGTPYIDSNQLVIDDASTIILIDENEGASSNYFPIEDQNNTIKIWVLELHYTFTPGATTNEIKFILDYVDSNNYIYVLFDLPNKNIEFRQVLSGTDSLLSFPELNTEYDSISIDFNYHYDQLADIFNEASFSTNNYLFEFKWLLVVGDITAKIQDYIFKDEGLYLVLTIHDLTNEKTYYLPTRYSSDITYTPGGKQGIGTTSTHSGNVFVDEIKIAHYYKYVDPVICTNDLCRICGKLFTDNVSFEDTTDDPLTSISFQPIQDNIIRFGEDFRLCAIDVISGNPTFNANNIDMQPGDKFIVNEIDDQKYINHTFLLSLDGYFTETNAQIYDYEFHIIFGYQDENNYFYLKCKQEWQPEVGAEDAYPLFTYELRRITAGTDTLLFDFLFAQHDTIMYGGALQKTFYLSQKDDIDGILLEMRTSFSEFEPYNVYNANNNMIKDFEHFYNPYAPITLFRDTNDPLRERLASLPLYLGTLPDGKYGLELVTLEKSLTTPENQYFHVTEVYYRRSSYNCKETDFWDCCDARVPPRGYSLTIAGVPNWPPTTGCLESVINQTYILEQEVGQNWLNYKKILMLSYGNIELDWCNGDVEETVKMSFQTIITNVTSTQISVKYSLIINNIIDCYTATATYNFLAFDCHNTNIVLNKNTAAVTAALNSHYGTYMPSTLTFVPV